MSKETFQDKLNRNAYRTKLPYFSPKEDPRGNKEFHDANTRLELEFKKDLFEELGITNNPKAEKLYNYAWDLGHSAGYHEVYSYAQDLLELIQ
jgi:hypothetical protein